MQDAEIINAFKQMAPELWQSAMERAVFLAKVGLGFGSIFLILATCLTVIGFRDEFEPEMPIFGALIMLLLGLLCVAMAVPDLMWPEVAALKSLLPGN